MKKAFLIILAAVMVLAVSCKQNPAPVYVEPEHEEVDLYLYQVGAPFMNEAKETDDYSFKLQILDKTSVSSSEELGAGDLKILDVTGGSLIQYGEGTLWFSQPDTGLGERNWKIRFKALFDSSSYGKAPSNKMPMYIYDAVGLNEFNEEIPDEELGYQASRLNGWVVVEFSDYNPVACVDRSKISRENGDYYWLNRYDYSRPKTFKLSVMDISDVSDKTRKLSSLPALDQGIIGASFRNDAYNR